LNKSRTAPNAWVILPGVFFAFTIFVFAPIEFYLTHANDFWFSLKDILPVLCVAALLCTILITLILRFLPQRASAFCEGFLYVLTLLIYVQGTYFVTDYGTLNGSEIDWNAFASRTIVNSVIWTVLIVVAVVLIIKFKSKFINVARYVSIVLMLTMVVSLVIIGITGHSGNQDAEQRYLSKKNELSVSSESNTIVLLLDAFDGQLMMDLNRTNRDYVADVLRDFTLYHNTVGGATRTKYAVPFIFGGFTNTDDVSYPEYVSAACAESPLFKELESGDYDVGIYTGNHLVDLKRDDVISNVSTGVPDVSSPIGLSADYMKLIAFRYVPSVFARYFWMYSGDFDRWKAGDVEGAYAVNDVAFYKELKSNNLTVGTNKKVFRFYHLNGAHAPYTMDENCESINYVDGSVEKQALGALRIVEQYIQQLKALGVYEQSTIIVMADHGLGVYSHQEQNPLFAVKLPGENHEFDISDTPLTYKRIPEFFALCLKGEARDLSVMVEEGDRYFYVESEKGSTINIKEYVVQGLAYDNDACHETGVVYHGNSLTLSREYKLGDIISFDKGDNARNYYVEGISKNEGTHSWTDGNWAKLSFEIGKKHENLLVSCDLLTVYKGIQFAEIYANDHLVTQHTFTSGGQYEFVIRKEYVPDGKLDLAFFFPGAISPKDLGESTDSRRLALALKSMRITSTREAAVLEEQQAYHYDVGTELSFRKESPTANTYMIHGFSDNEDSFTWTNGKRTDMLFRFDSEGKDLCLTMHYGVFSPPQTVRLFLNGHLLDEYTASQEEEKKVDLPAELVSERSAYLMLLLPDAVSPKEIGESDDGRLLSLKFESLTISSKD